jgi:hypothetical protein
VGHVGEFVECGGKPSHGRKGIGGQRSGVGVKETRDQEDTELDV